MRLGMTLGMTGTIDMALVLEAERLGFSMVWCGESYGTDAVTPITWVLAQTTKIKAGTGIMQMPARSPACAASTALTLQSLSGDRFLCGVGPSGPQVVEGWHGQPYGSPLVRTREYIEIMRAIIARERPLEYRGTHYRIPYDGPDATGLGKPLKSILHGKPMRFYCASITPGGMRLAGEIADGNLPIFMSPEKADLVVKPTLEGMAKAASPRALSDFDIAPYTKIRVGDDLQACRDSVKPELALYMAAWGPWARISTMITASALVFLMPRSPSKRRFWPGIARRLWLPCRMRWWMKSPWSARRIACAPACVIGRRQRVRAS